LRLLLPLHDRIFFVQFQISFVHYMGTSTEIGDVAAKSVPTHNIGRGGRLQLLIGRRRFLLRILLSRERCAHIGRCLSVVVVVASVARAAAAVIGLQHTGARAQGL